MANDGSPNTSVFAETFSSWYIFKVIVNVCNFSTLRDVFGRRRAFQPWIFTFMYRLQFHYLLLQFSREKLAN